MDLENWLQALVFTAKHFCNVFLRKIGSLDEFYRYLVEDWFVTGL